MLFRSKAVFDGGPRRRLLIGSWLGAGLLCAIVAFAIWDDYRDIRQGARARADTIEALVAADIARDIALYDIALQGVIAAVKNPRIEEEPLDLMRRALFDRAATLRGLGSLALLDDRGNVILDSAEDAPKADFADKDFFVAHRDGASGNDLFIGEPFKAGAQGGTWRIGLSRRILRENGSFGGVAAATLRLAPIKALLQGIASGSNSALTLFGSDGKVILAVGISQDAPGTGHFESGRKIGDWPLVLGARVPMQDLLSPWLRRSLALGLVAFVVAGCGLLALSTFGRELDRRAASDEAMAGMARTDGLTGLANRRAFDERLDVEWRRAERNASHFSLLMLDGDCFKAYNDVFGHVEGDQCLKAIADTLKRTLLRPGDLAARYGGEEFVVLLPATDSDSALFVAERIRQGVFDLQTSHPKNPFGVVTVSIGLATLKPRYVGHPATLVRAADEALYEAKAAGRNRIVRAPATEEDRSGPADSMAA